MKLKKLSICILLTSVLIMGIVNYAGARGRTGIITGKVYNAWTHKPIKKAIITTDLGNKARSMSDGSYMMVVPAGIFDITAEARKHLSTTVESVVVYGSKVTQINLYIIPTEGLDIYWR